MDLLRINQQAREMDVYIYGDITEYPWKDCGEASAASIADQIRAADVDIINVHVDSYGGSVKEGWGIYNAMISHKARVRSYADGFVASAALYPYLAGDERHAGPLSAFFLHQVITGADGYADDLRKAAAEADALTDIGIQAFVARAGMSEDKVRELMEAETWLTADQAKDYGIVTVRDEDTPTQRRTQAAQESAISKIFAREATPEQKRTLWDALSKI